LFIRSDNITVIAATVYPAATCVSTARAGLIIAHHDNIFTAVQLFEGYFLTN
jgi:hypothetical protein